MGASAGAGDRGARDPGDRGDRGGGDDDGSRGRPTRGELFGWLSGPGATVRPEPAPWDYRGSRLGRPEHGRGSVASFGRRLVALCVDWFSCYLVAYAALRWRDGGADLAEIRIWNSVLFFAEVSVLTAVAGRSFGQGLLGMAVVRVGGARLAPLGCLLRTALIMLVVPPLIWDRDGRGLHDKAVGSVVVRTR